MSATWNKHGQPGKKMSKKMRRSMMQPVNSNPWDWVEYLDLEKLQDKSKADSETDKENSNVPVGRIVDVSSCGSELDGSPTSKGTEKVSIFKSSPDHLELQRKSFVHPDSVVKLCMDKLKQFSMQEHSETDKENSNVPVGRIVDVSSCGSELDGSPTSKGTEKVSIFKSGPDHIALQRKSFVHPDSVVKLCMDKLKQFSMQEHRTNNQNNPRPSASLPSTNSEYKSSFRPKFQARIPFAVSPEVSVAVGHACNDDVREDAKKPQAGLHTSLDEVHHLPLSPDKWIFTSQASKYKYTFDHKA